MTDSEHTSQEPTRNAPPRPKGGSIPKAFVDAPPPSESPGKSPGGKGRKIARWAVLALAAVLFGLLMREVLYPFRGQPYMEISHGNHTHYVPKDRNETVPISSFPTRPPGPKERITPDGDLVSKKKDRER